MSKYGVKGFGPIKIEGKWPQPPKKGLFYDFEALPSPSWCARPPITPNFFHTPIDLSNQHGLWSKAFGEGPELAVSQRHSMLKQQLVCQSQQGTQLTLHYFCEQLVNQGHIKHKQNFSFQNAVIYCLAFLLGSWEKLNFSFGRFLTMLKNGLLQRIYLQY